jgi:alpha-methylacyl-CoA racemase
VADSAAGGMQAAVAILAALLRRARTGQGEYLDVSVAEGVLALMALHVDEHLATGAEPGPGSNVLTGRYACYDCYQARDGAWLAVGAIEAAFWANLCRALGLDKLVQRQYDDDAQDELRAELARVFAGEDRQHWLDLLLDADTCVTPVYSIDELVDDPQFAARGVFGTAEHPAEGRLRQVAPLMAGQQGADGSVQLPDPGATHTRELLGAAGLGAEALDELFDSGAVA